MAQNGKILEKDIIEKGSYEIGEKLAKSLKPAVDEVENLKQKWIAALNEMKQAALDLQAVQGQFKGANGMKEFIAAKKLQTEAIEKAAKAAKEEAAAVLLLQKAETEKLRTQKESITVQEKEISLSNKNESIKRRIIELTAKERYEISVLNKQNRELAILSSRLSTEYEKQSVRLEILRRKYKDVALTLGENSREARRLQKEAKELDAILKRVDANVGQFQRNVGNYGLALKSAGAAAREMMGAMGIVSGASLFVAVMADAFKTVREFDKSMQTMAGVLQKSRKELKQTEQFIIDFSSETTASAVELANLGIELARLGKSEPEIRKLIRPVSNLALALEATSEEAGTFLVQMLNAFGDGADEAENYANTIASISNTTSLDFTKMKDSLQYIVPISRILNKDLAYTGAVVGILADNSLKAESAGRLLATAQQRLSKDGKTLNQALKEINDAQAKGVKGIELLKLANTLFGAEAAKVGIILANNTDIIEKNAQAIRDNGSALDDLVKEQMESLDSKLKKLSNSWEKLVLTIESGQGPAGEFFGDLFDSLSMTLNQFAEFEAAAGRVEEILGRGQGWGRFDYNDDYDKAINQMIELMKNAEVTEQSLSQLNTTYNDLNNRIKDKNRYSEEEIAVFKNQAEVYKNAIEANKENRKSLEEQAVQLGFNEKMLVVFSETISSFTDHELKDFIEANDKSTKSTEESTDATSKSKEELAAEAKAQREANKAKREAEKAERDAQRAIEEYNKALEKRIELLKKSRYELSITQLDSEINQSQNTIENEEAPITQRLGANQDQFQDNIQKAEEQRSEKKRIMEKELEDLKTHNLSLAKNEADKNKIIEEYAEIHKNKLKEIEIEFNDQIAEAEEKRSKNGIEIVKDEFEKRLEEIKQAQEAEKALRNQELQGAEETFKSSAQTPEDVEKYRLAVKAINDKYDLSEIQSAKDKAQQILDTYVLSTDAREQLMKFITDKSKEYSDEELEQLLENLGLTKQAYELLNQKRLELISQMSGGLADALGADERAVFDFFDSVSIFAEELFVNADDKAMKFKDVMVGVLTAMSAAASITRDIIAATFQANIDELEAQKEASNEYYENQIEQAEGDSVMQDLLREEQNKKEEEYNKRIKKEKTDAAKADKNAKIIQANINTALAITSALTMPPPASYVMAAISAAMGIAQIALIAAQPIPKFKKGTRNFKGGLAILGDGGVSEIVRTPDGKVSKTPNKDTLYNLPAGTDVFKSEDEYQKLFRASILTSVALNNGKVKDYNARSEFYKNHKAIDEKAIQKAISDGFKNQKVHFHTTANAKVDLNYSYWAMKQINRG